MPNTEHCVTICKRVILMKIRKVNITKETTGEQYLEAFKNLSKDLFKYLINPMAIEMNNIFHLRKKAWELKNTQHKQIGSLDMTKIFAYKTSDNLFKKKTWKPQGKSHGIVIAIDFSSSMHSTIMSCLVNAAAITMFCKRNKIPCVVVTFTSLALSNKEPSTKNNTGMNTKGLFGISTSFDSKIFFSDKMSEYDIMCNFYNILLMVHRDEISRLTSMFKHKSEIVAKYREVPHLNMNATPLTMGMWCGIDNAMEMKKTVQQVTLLTISDGMGNQQFSTGTFNCVYNNQVYKVDNMENVSEYKPKSKLGFMELETIMMNEICKDIGINSIHINLTHTTNTDTTYPLPFFDIPGTILKNANEKYSSNGYVVMENVLNFNKSIIINQSILDRFLSENIVFEESRKHKIIGEKEQKKEEMLSNVNGLKKVLKKAGNDMNTVKEISRVVVEEICKNYR